VPSFCLKTKRIALSLLPSVIHYILYYPAFATICQINVFINWDWKAAGN
jgi:hypothetical protein